MKQHYPEFKWSSMQVNKNTISEKHRDEHNVGMSVALLAGDFFGGGLVIEGHPGLFDAGVLSKFDGMQEHWSLPFKGTRFSIIFFNHRTVDKIPLSARPVLEELGYQLKDTIVEQWCGSTTAAGDDEPHDNDDDEPHDSDEDASYHTPAPGDDPPPPPSSSSSSDRDPGNYPDDYDHHDDDDDNNDDDPDSDWVFKLSRREAAMMTNIPR